MTSTLTQLNTTTNTNQLIHHIVKRAICLLSFACFMLNVNIISAQTNDCPGGDPLELEWIQNLIANNNCDALLIEYIKQFEYNGNNYFYTFQDICNDYIADGEVINYYDCNGNFICFSAFFNASCSDELFDASRNSTTIWRYEYNCTDPFELQKVQNAIENDCTDAIYAFDYEGDPYLYFKVGCNYSDVLYECKTKKTCRINRVNGTLTPECSTLMEAVQPLLNEDNAIWTNNCSYEITGTVYNSESCGLYIGCCLDSQYEPLILPEGFSLQEGQNVEFNVNDLNTGNWCLPLGMQVEITCIRKIADNCGCYSYSSYPVCGADGNTYNNACLARCNGIEVAYSGECTPCYDEDPLQATWLIELIANDEGCAVHEIQQFNYNGEPHFAVYPYKGGAGFDRNGQACYIDVGTTFYDCIGNIVCYYDGMYNSCDTELFNAAGSATTVWTYNETGCINPLETNFVQEWLNRDCLPESIYSFEHRGETFIYVDLHFYCDIYYDNDEVNFIYNCSTGFACIPNQNCYDMGESFFEAYLNDDNLIWTKPCSYELTGEVVESEDYYDDDGNNCGGLVIRIVADGYQGYFEPYYIIPETWPEGFVLQEGQTVELSWRYNDYNYGGNGACGYFSGYVDIPCIRVANQGNQMKCPENNITSICAPVNVAPSLTMQDFSTTDDPNYMSSMLMQMEEQIDVQQYFTTTTQVYTISDGAGNQKTCETKYQVARQFLKAPEVSQPGVVCEEDLWSYIKIGPDQYKIYADNNGVVGEEMSTCNTTGIICSTTDLDVDTKVPIKYNFWVSTFFEFPDGSICESEATTFSVDVQPKPVAKLSEQNKSIQLGESILLTDLVTTNKSGYWSGKNITYLMTATGDNIAYFSSNNTGVYKLYYTVSNGICERSYLLTVEVDGAVDKTKNLVDTHKQNLPSFNMYPNPTADKVFIDLPNIMNCHISLMDISGKVIKQMAPNETMVEVNLSNLPKGMYLMEVKNTATRSIQKLIIK